MLGRVNLKQHVTHFQDGEQKKMKGVFIMTEKSKLKCVLSLAALSCYYTIITRIEPLKKLYIGLMLSISYSGQCFHGELRYLFQKKPGPPE